MSRPAWRIATYTPSYEADDLSSAGAKATGGRWNSPGVPIVYSSQTRALACLETVVHLGAGGLPLNRYLVRVDIPDAIWAAARHETAATLPVGWDAEPAGRASIAFGSAWIQASSSALLVVPSVIVPEEFNVLINPQHPDGAQISATKLRRWLYDQGWQGRFERALAPTMLAPSPSWKAPERDVAIPASPTRTRERPASRLCQALAKAR